MSKKRLLYVTQSMKPYLDSDSMAETVHRLAVHGFNKGYEVRVLMPRFSVINERRHRLHEVVRLSGMNIIIDNDDYPLIIKVASLPGARLQVYFLDNEDLFHRKDPFLDDKGNFYDDTHERMVFFCKGVMETMKKFGWPPDIIHCNGWMTSLVPFYAKTVYKKEPVFSSSKIVYSAYENKFTGTLHDDFEKKALIHKDLKAADFKIFKNGDDEALNLGAISTADALVIGDAKVDKNIAAAIKKSGKPFLDKVKPEDMENTFFDFYASLLKK